MDGIELNPWKDMRVPLTVALVTTVDIDGNANASPKTWWTPTSYEPALLTVALKPTSDTYKNVAELGVFGLHLPSASVAKEVLHTAKPIASDLNELDVVGLIWRWVEHEKLPRPVPVVDDMPWMVCFVNGMVQTGDHMLVGAQVGLVGGYDLVDGVSDVMVHRGANRFMNLGTEYEVEPY